MAIKRASLKWLTWTYDPTENGGAVGANIQDGILVGDFSLVIVGFGRVINSFTGGALCSIGIGQQSAPNSMFPATDVTLLTAGTPIFLNSGFMPLGEFLTIDISNTPALTGKLIISAWVQTLPE